MDPLPRKAVSTTGTAARARGEQSTFGGNPSSVFVYNSGEYCVPEETWDIVDIQSYEDDEASSEKFRNAEAEETVKNNETDYEDEDHLAFRTTCLPKTRRHGNQYESQPCASASVLGSGTSKPSTCENVVNNGRQTKKLGMLPGSHHLQLDNPCLRQQYPGEQAFFPVDGLQTNSSLVRNRALVYYKPHVNHSNRVVFADKSKEVKPYLAADISCESPIQRGSHTSVHASSNGEPQESESKFDDQADEQGTSDRLELEIHGESTPVLGIQELAEEQENGSELDSEDPHVEGPFEPNPNSQHSGSPELEQRPDGSEGINEAGLGDNALFQMVLQSFSSTSMLDALDLLREEQ